MIRMRRELLDGGSVLELYPETEQDEKDLSLMADAGLLEDESPLREGSVASQKAEQKGEPEA